MRKPAPPREIPPPLELKCLRALWQLGEGSVKDVREAMLDERNLAYTTIMTVLDRLARRGAVARRKSGRAYIYVPVLEREELRRLAVEELVAAFFSGSRQALLDYLQQGPAVEPAPGSEAPPTEEPLDTALL